MVWKKLQHKMLWTNWIYFNPDMGNLTNLDDGIKREFHQMQVRSLP